MPPPPTRPRGGLRAALDSQCALPAGVFLAASAAEAAALSADTPAAAAAPLSVDLTAGTMAGIAQLTVGHPFDTIKVKLQNMPAPAPGAAPLYTSALDATRKTIAADGPIGLYAGITAPLAFVAVFNAILFAANSTMRSLVGRGRHVDALSLRELAVCGAGAGFGVSWVACPTELVKCRLQSQSSTGTAYTGPVDCARKVIAARGVTGIYKGMGATLAREMPANGIYFGAYESMKRRLAGPGKSTEGLGSGSLMMAGGVAGVGFWGTVYPIDVIKTRLQTDSDTRPRYRGMADCARKIVAAEGAGALYRGVGPCLARAFPANAVTFLVFEWVKEALAPKAAVV